MPKIDAFFETRRPRLLASIYGTEPPDIDTSKFTLSRDLHAWELLGERASERKSGANEQASGPVLAF